MSECYLGKVKSVLTLSTCSQSFRKTVVHHQVFNMLKHGKAYPERLARGAEMQPALALPGCAQPCFRACGWWQRPVCSNNKETKTTKQNKQNKNKTSNNPRPQEGQRPVLTGLEYWLQ